MSEREVPAQAVIIDWLCDRCQVPMRCLDMMLTSDPPQWKHVCDGCGANESLHQRYPATVFRRLA